jgi:hypothetical protein
MESLQKTVETLEARVSDMWENYHSFNQISTRCGEI